MAIIVLTRVTRYGTPDPRAPVSVYASARSRWVTHDVVIAI
jgi:hypothetical protein